MGTEPDTTSTDPRIRYITDHLDKFVAAEHDLARISAAVSDVAERHGTDAQKRAAGRLVGTYLHSAMYLADFVTQAKELTVSLEHTLMLNGATLPETRDVLAGQATIRKAMPDVEAVLTAMARGMGGAEVLAEVAAGDPYQRAYQDTAFREADARHREAEHAVLAYLEALRKMLPTPPTAAAPRLVPAVPATPSPKTDHDVVTGTERLPEVG